MFASNLGAVGKGGNRAFGGAAILVVGPVAIVLELTQADQVSRILTSRWL